MENQKKEFTGIWIPRHIIEDEELSMSEMIIYSEISCFEVCYKSNESIGKRWGLKPNTISIIISKLSNKGYVEKLSFNGRDRALKAKTDNPIKGCLSEKSKADYDKNATIDNILENKDIYIAGKPAVKEKQVILAKDKEPPSKGTNLQDLYSRMGLPTRIKTVSKWQDEAAAAVKYFKDIQGKESSVFKCFKDNNQKARIALSDCKELEKSSVYYFLKVYNEIKK